MISGRNGSLKSPIAFQQVSRCFLLINPLLFALFLGSPESKVSTETWPLFLGLYLISLACKIVLVLEIEQPRAHPRACYKVVLVQLFIGSRKQSRQIPSFLQAPEKRKDQNIMTRVPLQEIHTKKNRGESLQTNYGPDIKRFLFLRRILKALIHQSGSCLNPTPETTTRSFQNQSSYLTHATSCLEGKFKKE